MKKTVNLFWAVALPMAVLFMGIALIVSTLFTSNDALGQVDTAGVQYIDGSATTSVIYLTSGGAASEDTFSTSGWDSFSVDTQLNASTTATILTSKFYVSQDGIDWFDLPNVTQGSAIANTVGSTTASYTYAPQTAGINRVSFRVSSDHKWFKINRSLTGANGSVWQQVVPTISY